LHPDIRKKELEYRKTKSPVKHSGSGEEGFLFAGGVLVRDKQNFHGGELGRESERGLRRKIISPAGWREKGGPVNFAKKKIGISNTEGETYKKGTLKRGTVGPEEGRDHAGVGRSPQNLTWR